MREISLDSEGQEAARADSVEEHIAACMAAEGFQYTPLSTTPIPVVNPADAGALPGSIEFAEQFGYGITTSPWMSPGGASVEPEDPNLTLVGAMSASEMREYYAALYGTSAPDEPYDWRTGGCAGAADHEVNDTIPGLDSEAFVALREELVRVLLITNDPSLEPLVEDWVGCMSEAGHPGLTAVEEPAAAIAAESATTPVDDLWALSEREIEVATADARCRSQVGYDRALRAVQVRRQEEFYGAHRAELEAWREAVHEQAEARS